MKLSHAPQLVNPGMDRPVTRSRQKRLLRYAMPAALGLALLGGVAWFMMVPAERSLRVAASTISIGTVTAAPFKDFIPMRGQVVPLDSIVLDAVEGGRVDTVLVEAGQRVTAGQPLIRLSNANIELDVIARETQVIEQINNQNSLELSFARSQTDDAHAVAETEYNVIRLGRSVARRDALAAKGFTAQETLDQVSDELAYQRRLHEIALDAQHRDSALIEQSGTLVRETRERLNANLAVARRLLDDLTVKAPADGVLTALDAHPGETKERGARLGQIDRDGGVKITVDVDEFYLARVKPGQHVDVTIDGKPAALSVAKVYPQVKDGKFAVDLAFDAAAPDGLRRGQAVQGRLELGGDAASIILPSGPFLGESGGAWVFVLAPDGHSASRRVIKTGRRTLDAVEVLFGLQPGERVVTSDYTGFDRIDRIDIAP